MQSLLPKVLGKSDSVGVDVIIAQSYEAGGHTGEIGGMVLIPEIVDAVAPVPVLYVEAVARLQEQVGG